jgi:hypothetical protein
MRKLMLATALFVGGAGVLALTVPAAAATTGGTPVTAEVSGGALAITVPAGPVDLGTVAASINAQTVSSPLGLVTVTDNRGGTAGWVATAGANDFTGPMNISTSAAGSVTYASGTATVTGVATVTPTDQDHLYPPSTVQTATGVNGVNTAAWNPTITVTIPGGTQTGTYSTTITHSVS